MKILLKVFLISSLALIVSGCVRSRVTIVDSNADWVKLGPDMTGHVYILKNEKWTLQDKKVHLPEGWIAGPEPKE